MHNLDLILTLTAGLASALVLGYITQRIGLSPIVGYLLAGIAIGRHTPGFVADRHLAEQLAEVGVVLLMFGVGLQFHVKELLAVRRIAVPGAIGQSVVATVLGTLAALCFGWGWGAGLVYGLAISVASTVVLVRILSDNNDLHTPTGHIAVGWLVVEDLFTVVVLVLLPALFGREDAASRPWPLALGIALLNIGILVAITFVVGGRVVPWLLTRAAATRSRELFTLTILVVALGIAVGSAKLFGVSMALGAFLAGMVVGRSDFSLRAASEALPMRDAFAVLFFVSVGMLFDPRILWKAPGVVTVTLAIILIGKPLAALVIALLRGFPVTVALNVAVALAQIGEFSFILASLGKSLGILTEHAHTALIAAAIVTISLNPLLYRGVDPALAWAARRPRLWMLLTSRVSTPAASPTGPDKSAAELLDARHRAVIIGYGPVGKTVTRLLRENDIQPTVVELNLDTVQRLRAEGTPAVYGDASHADVLRSAGVPSAASLILSASGTRGSAEVIRQARELNPAIRILARANYVHELRPLRQAGAETVFAGEAEIALALTETILEGLGATPEQIDRERDRVRDELLGRPEITAPREQPPQTQDTQPASAPPETTAPVSESSVAKSTSAEAPAGTASTTVADPVEVRTVE
jgi:CPA2 family monovalent cation:H+ antiporter-2